MKTKLLFSAVLLLIAVFLLIYMDLYFKRKEVRNSLIQSSLEIQKKLGEITEQTEYVMNIANDEIKINHKDKEHIRNTLRRLRTSPNLINYLSWTIFSWSDTNYNLIVDAFYGIMEPPYFNMLVRDYIKPTSDTPRKLMIGQPVHGSTSNKWMIPVGVGSESEEGEYLGTIAVGFVIDVLLLNLKNVVEDSNVDIYFLDKNLNPIEENKFGENFDSKIKDDLDKFLNDKNINDVELIYLSEPADNYKIIRVLDGGYILVLKYDNYNIVNNSLINSLDPYIEIILLSLVALLLILIIYVKRDVFSKSSEQKASITI